MIKQGHVGTSELFALITIYQIVLIFYNLPVFLAGKVATGAWLLNLLLSGVSFLFFLPIFFLLKRFPGQSIIAIAEKLLGRPGQLCVTFGIAGFYLYQVYVFLRVGGDGILSTILFHTPLTAVFVMVFFTMAVVSYLGFESLTRTALIFFPFILLGFGLITLLSTSDLDFSGIYPLWGAPLKAHITNAGILAPIVHDYLFLAIISPYLRRGKSVLALVFWSAIFVAIISTGMIILIQMSFPYPEIKSLTFPLFQLVRMIYIGRFLQRIEALYVIMSVVATTIHICIIFHLCVLSLAQGLKLTDWRPLIFPVGVIAVALCYVPQNALEISRWYYSLPNSAIFMVTVVGLPLSLYGLAAIKGMRGGSGFEQKNELV